MSNRSYVIALVKQTFMHSWRTSLQTFVNSVSNKQCSWTHTRHRVQQTRRASLDQGANWFGAPATNARRVSEANRIFNRTNPPIVAKIKDCENCTHAKFAQFSNNWQRFFRRMFAIQVVNHWPTPIANSLRSGTRHAARSRACVPRNRPPKKGKTECCVLTYEQLFICRLSKLPPQIVSIVLRKLAIVNISSRKQEWTFVHSIVLRLIYQKFN